MEQGIALCRAGEWERGVTTLTHYGEQGGRLSSLGYSFLGYGIAHLHRKVPEGLRLCRHAVKLEFFQPDNLLNLARTELLAGNRRAAVDSLQRGLALDPQHAALRELEKRMGSRRSPVLGFLARDNPLNVLLGRLRHSIRT
jgi:hypothetical protein